MKNFFGHLSGEVAIVGDVILDKFVYFRDASERVAENGKAPIFSVASRTQAAGGAGTPARCIQNLGGKVEVFSVVGRHPETLLAEFAKSDIPLFSFFSLDRPTPVKERMVDARGQLILVGEEQSRRFYPVELVYKLLAKIKRAKAPVLLISDFGRGLVSPRFARGLSDIAREQGKTLIVDARPRPLSWYQSSFPFLHLITPNRQEAAAMVGFELRNMSDVRRAGHQIQEALKCSVLLKLSEEGAMLFEFGGEELFLPALNTKPVSVVGAGDSFSATIALAIAAGHSLRTGCKLGALAAAATCGKPGVAVATWGDIQVGALEILREEETRRT